MNSESEVVFFFDSDALIQILLTAPEQIFPILRSDFNVTSFIMNEVEIEVRSNRKFGQTVQESLDKAMKSKMLRLVSSADLEALTVDSSSPISLADIRELGREFALHVGNGEAFTHAAGVLLNCPVISNDLNAIRTLEANGKELPPTILRSHDLFVFAHTEGYLDGQRANRILKTLRRYGEWMPRCFENASFEDGVARFGCRLSTSLAVSASSTDWSATFYLKRHTAATEGSDTVDENGQRD